MKTSLLSSLFDICYGNQLDLNKMALLNPENGGINFIGRSGKNHGVANTVGELSEVLPYREGLITVALGGSILSSFVQQAPFYTAQNVAVLTPETGLTLYEKVYYCMCIHNNAYRYSAYGREANVSLGDICVPSIEHVPSWTKTINIPSIFGLEQSYISQFVKLPLVPDWKYFELGSIFQIKKGRRLTKANQLDGSVPFIGSSAENNGITTFVGQDAEHDGGTISVCYNGSIGEAFYQPVPFYASDDVNVLYPTFDMNPAIALFVCALIRKEKYRFNYGRKWHTDRMNISKIKLPVDDSENPDWNLISMYVHGLPFSQALKASGDII